MSKKTRAKSFIILAGVYLLAAVVGFLTYIVLPNDEWLKLLIADIAATAIVFIFSMIFDNSSIFDPFWAFAPVVVLTTVATGHPIDWLKFLTMLAVSIWSLRYLTNWIYTFRDIRQESAAYEIIHDKVKDGFPLVSLFVIHLIPTAITYACILPAIFIIEQGESINIVFIILIVLTMAATILQSVIDYQRQKFLFLKNEGFLKTGLWKKSRHPSFLTEVFVWWGLAGAAISVVGFSWHLIVGAILSTAYLLGMKAVLADRVYAKQEGFERYKKEVPMHMSYPFRKKYEEEKTEEKVEEVVVIADGIDDADIEAAMAVPDVALADIDYVDDDIPIFVATAANSGTEVVGVVWPERSRRNKIYKYDPNGEKFNEGDIVLVPSRDVAKNRDIIRKATVAHGNYVVDDETLHKPLKKVIAIVKHN